MINTAYEQVLTISLSDKSISHEVALLSGVIKLSSKAGFKKEFPDNIRAYAQERLDALVQETGIPIVVKPSDYK